MKKMAILALIAVAGAAAASAITVGQRTEILNIFAERIDLAQTLVVSGPSTILPSPTALNAVGTQALPLELAAGLPAARTAIARDDWAYTVEVREANAGALASGVFDISLYRDNVLAGSVRLEQRAPAADAVEGARVTFSLGATLTSSALYHVEIRPVTAELPSVSYTLRSVTGYKWKGVGGAIDGQEGPTLTVPLGHALRLTARNDDGEAHNIGIKGASGVLPPGWTDDIDARGEEVTLGWTPTAAGSYTYACKYHSGMTGTVTVTS